MATLNQEKKRESLGPANGEVNLPPMQEGSIERAEQTDKRARMTLEFSAQLNSTIEWLATELDLKSKTDVIKRAITLLAFVTMNKRKGKLALVDENDKVVTLIALM